MERFAIVRNHKELSELRYKQIKEALSKHMIYDEEYPELVISVGGDGTILDAVSKYIDCLDKVCFVGLHTGTLGFFTDYEKDEWEDLVNDVLKNEYKEDRRCMLEIRKGDEVYYALNEMRIEENHRTMVCDVYMNGEYLERFRGNGLCVSTPSGSTALNRSLGGSVIACSLPSIQLSEIAGIHHNAYRSLQSSLILDSSSYFTFKPQQSEGLILGLDRQVIPLHADDAVITARISPDHRVRFIRYRHRGLCKRLRKAFISE